MTEDGKGSSRFRVSDAVPAPLRGVVLRLKLLDGRPRIDDLKPGSTIRLWAPDGAVRQVRVKALALTGGRTPGQRLELSGLVDVVIGADDAAADGRAVAIGWLVTDG